MSYRYCSVLLKIARCSARARIVSRLSRLRIGLGISFGMILEEFQLGAYSESFDCLYSGRNHYLATQEPTSFSRIRFLASWRWCYTCDQDAVVLLEHNPVFLLFSGACRSRREGRRCNFVKAKDGTAYFVVSASSLHNSHPRFYLVSHCRPDLAPRLLRSHECES